MNEERGAATVLAMALASVLMLVGMSGAWVGAAVARHRAAQSAADLSALAGAQAVQEGREPCAAAAEVAQANRVRLSACSQMGDDVSVSVELDAPPLLGRSGTLTGRARAGPGT